MDAGLGPQAVAVGDFNGDGAVDLVTANYGLTCGLVGCFVVENDIRVMLGNGDGSFQPAQTFAVGNEPTAVAVGDFNGDGIADLAVVNATSETVSVLLGTGDGTFQTRGNVNVGRNPDALAVGDFNGDGIPDLVTANYAETCGLFGCQTTESDGRVLLGKGDGSFGPATPFAAGDFPISVAVGDFNGDGVPDLAVADVGDFNGPTYVNSVSVLLGTGDGSFGRPLSYTAGLDPVAVAAADLNGDGLPDLAVANVSSNDVSVLLNDGQWPDGASPSPHRHPPTHAARRASPRGMRSLGVALPAPQTPGGTSVRPADQVPEPPLLARAVDDLAYPRMPARAPSWQGRAHHHPPDLLFQELGDEVLAVGSEDNQMPERGS